MAPKGTLSPLTQADKERIFRLTDLPPCRPV